MTYKIPDVPSSRSYKEETADFWEVEAVRNPGSFVSQTHIVRALSSELDEINHDGIESEDDVLHDGFDTVYHELNRRISSSAHKYPFEFKTYSIKLVEEDSTFKQVYVFLLLATRLKMSESKIQNGIDGTLVFERLCAHVARNYFGRSAFSSVFGTSQVGLSFEARVNELTSSLGEGKSFKNPNNNSPTSRDGSVDIVVWKEFSDKRIGKLIGFGQCKTGTTWRDQIHKLKPIDFCDTWFYEQPILSPIPIVFLSDTMNENFNFYQHQKGFLVFNRFRIMEYVNYDLEEEIISDIRMWNKGVLSGLKINEYQ